MFEMEAFIMKTCSKCNAQLNDEARFCTICGAQCETVGDVQQNSTFSQQSYQCDPTDHTSEFDAQDISENKIFSLICYLMGIIGIIIALLGARTSKYVAFHVKQALKISIIEAISGIVAVLLGWTFIIPIILCIFIVLLYVIKIICFIQVCQGRAKEPVIINYISFLK